MNNKKTSNLLRLIAFFLTAVMLVCTFGFTVDGWTFTDDGQNGITEDFPSNNPTVDNTDRGGEKDEQDKEEETPDEPQIYIPEFTNALTGLETTEELSLKAPLAFVIDGNTPLFGISGADILCDIPVEEEKIRSIAFLSNTDNLWKIGSIAPCRGYIGNVIKYFGGIAVSAGNDDSLSYTSCNMAGNILDLTVNDGYYYTEQQNRFYTNKDLIYAGLANSAISTEKIAQTVLPYSFTDFGSNNVTGDLSAKEIRITQARDNTATLTYNETSGLYSLNKNGDALCDTLNGKQFEFKNCFVLFADSVTYDKAEYSQTVVDTIGSGRGYYFTEGSAIEITWTATAAGVMTFYSLEGQKLTVNRGSSYISYLKASKTEDLNFS